MKTSRAIYTVATIWCIITLFTFSFIWSPSIYHYFVSAFGITISLLTWFFIKIHRNCSTSSVANSRSTTSSGKFNWYKQPSHTTINEECKNFVYIFPRDDFMLLSTFNCCNYFRFYYCRFKSHTDFLIHSSTHELVCQSIFVLLAYDWAQSRSF